MYAYAIDSVKHGFSARNAFYIRVLGSYMPRYLLGMFETTAKAWWNHRKCSGCCGRSLHQVDSIFFINPG
jgi:hypothetical protein